MNTKQAILDKVEESFLKAEKFYGRTFSRAKNIIFLRSGTTGGYCCYGRSEFMFQLDFCEANMDDYIKQVVPHEVAHWIDKEVYGYKYTRSGRRIIHGNNWKYIMVRVMGIPADRCHNYDTSVTKTKKQERFEYICQPCNKTYNVTKTKHNRMLTGKANYCCMKCNTTITLKVKSKEDSIEELKKKIEALKLQLTNNQGVTS